MLWGPCFITDFYLELDLLLGGSADGNHGLNGGLYTSAVIELCLIESKAVDLWSFVRTDLLNLTI